MSDKEPSAFDILNKFYKESKCEICGGDGGIMAVSRTDHRLSCFSCANKKHNKSWNAFLDFNTGPKQEPKSK